MGSSLEMVLNRNREALQRDNNWGLAKQVQESLYKKIIQRLTQTFLTLSLNDMALRVQLPNVVEAEKLVLTMIEDGDIFASISQKDGMVLFNDNPDKYDSTATVERLQKEVNICVNLDVQVQKMEEVICVNELYVKKSHRNCSGRGRGSQFRTTRFGLYQNGLEVFFHVIIVHYVGQIIQIHSSSTK